MTWGVLVGIVVGWVLAQIGDYISDERQARRARKIAALLSYAELTSNLAIVSALRKYGVWSSEERVHRTGWEAQGAAFLHGGDLDRTGRLTVAYNALEDVGFFAKEAGRDFTKGSDAEFLDSTLLPAIYNGMREVGPVADVSQVEIDKRIADTKALTSGKPSDQ